MANNEDYLDALTAYSKSPGVEIPAVLDQYLNGVAKNGETLFQWQLLKPLIVGKMEQVLGDLRHRLSSENIPERPNVENLRFDVMHDRIMDALHKFNGAPFTIQRLCELLIDPKRHYKRSDKFLRGLEKNVLVVSTVDPFGRKVVSESGSKHLVNGVDTNGSPFFPRDSNISSNLPPVPGWVTTTATTRPQSNLSVDLPDQKLTKEQSHEDSPIPSNGSAVNSLYAEHGEQPPVVHSEEVIEETVVTMDTNEAGAVATDGGEAMAEEDDDDDEITDDTNASSSSSSPEEQSSSDTGESSGALTEVTTVTSSSETEARPWAEITKEDESSVSSDVDSLSSNATKECLERLSTELPPDKQANSPTSSEAEPGPSNHTQDDVADSLAESEPETSSDESVEQLPNACSVDTSTSEATDNVTDHQDVQSNESHSNDSINVTESDITSNNLTSTDDKISSSSSASETTFSSNDLHTQEPSSSNSCDDTDIIASSTTDSSSHLLNSSEECDSVVGLERLVDSVEPCQSQTLLSSLAPTCTFLPTATKQNTNESSPLSSTFDSHIDCEEPRAKKCRLSDDESFSSLSPTMSDSVKTNIDPSTINDTPGVDSLADTTSDSTSQIPAASWEDNSESQESLTTTCGEKDLDIQDNMSDSNQENISSPLSQHASSGDSQGFDAIEDMDHKKELDESQTQEEPKTITSEKAENVQEPMDQE